MYVQAHIMLSHNIKNIILLYRRKSAVFIVADATANSQWQESRLHRIVNNI